MLKRYLRDTSGNFAIMFSLVTTALIGLGGLAVDISQIQSHKQNYQDLSDAAVLAAAVSGLQTEEELQSIAENMVASLTGETDYNVVASITPENAIQVVVSKPQKLFLMNALGDIDISVLSEAPPRGEVKMNVALVLDVTKSMEGQKLQALKAAATSLVEEFEESGNNLGGGGLPDDDDLDDDGLDDDNGLDDDGLDDDGLDDESEGANNDEGDGSGGGPGGGNGGGPGSGNGAGGGGGGSSAALNDVKFSVVPFARYVRLDTDLEDESWLNVEPPNESCWQDLDLEASQAQGTCTPNTSESGGYSCTNAVYVEKCADVKWYGCVASRQYPWNKRPDIGPKLIQGFAGGGNCKAELSPLSSDLDGVKGSIGDLEVKDETYIPAGLIWGWRTLTPEAPFEQADTEDFDERKHVMILMTDGKNSRSLGGEKDNGFEGVMHWDSDLDAANDLTSELCNDIKEDGIEMYTIAFEVDDMNTQSLLTQCASDPSKYFDASDATQLLDAFNTIGKELAAVRLSK